MRHIVFVLRAILLTLMALTVALAIWGQNASLPLSLSLAGPLLALLLLTIRRFGNAMMTEVLSDASRWFAPKPADIPKRDEVRRLGLELIRSLHRPDDSGRARYGRIVVIGHSLGSVISYDIIRMAFDELREPSDLPSVATSRNQPIAWNFEKVRSRLESESMKNDVSDDLRVDYQRVQRHLHEEQRKQGVSWLVTDFITLGSPLAHARDLWRSPVADFDRRVAEGEFPLCPPLGTIQNSEKRRAGRVSVPAGSSKLPVAFYRRSAAAPLVAHEASPFASTRWTNLYVPMRWWLGGDPIGGKLAPVFGYGIRDVAVSVSAPTIRRFLISVIPVRAHSYYWKRSGRPSANEESSSSVRQLRDSLKLNEKKPTTFSPEWLAFDIVEG